MRKRGFVLVMSLMVAVLVVMFVSAGAVLMPGRGDEAAHFGESESALAACEAGYQYARTRLQQDPNWAGGGNATIVDTAAMTVVEDRGNVYGFMTDPLGRKSQFRIRFNFHNGTSLPSESQSDPANANLRPKMPYVSVNNLSKATPAKVYRADLVGAVYRVQPTSQVAFDLPKYSCCVYVEGLAGEALANCSPTNPDPPAGNRRYVRKISEAVLVRPGMMGVDAAVYGSLGVNATVGTGLEAGTVKVETADGSVPKVRSLQNVTVAKGNALNAAYSTTATGQVIVTPGSKFELNGSVSTSPSATIQSSTQQKKRWLKLKWSDVKQAAPTAAKIRAGTYVWRHSGTPRLEYYPQEFDGTNVPSGPPALVFTDANASSIMLSGSGAVMLNSGTYKFRVEKDVIVEPQGAVKGLAIVPDPAMASALQRRPATLFRPPTGTTTAPILSAPDGQVYLASLVDGKGAVTAGGNITFQGASYFETNPTQSVALYSKKDITMLPIPPAGAGALPVPAVGSGGDHDNDHGDDDSGGTGTTPDFFMGLPTPFGAPAATDVAFGGVIFAMGNFSVDLAGMAGTRGNLYLRGAVAAYGGDPENQDPGQGAGGLVHVRTTNAHFVFDPNYLGQSQNLNAPGPLIRSMWNTL